MKKILLLLLPFILCWNCFTVAVLGKHDLDIGWKRDALPYLSESVYEIAEVKRSDTKMIVSYKTGLYAEKDGKFKYNDQRLVCTLIKSLGANSYSYADISPSDYSICDKSPYASSEPLLLEEIKEFKNGIWLQDLNIILSSEKGLDTITNHLPSPHQFSKMIYLRKKWRYKNVNFLKHYKSLKIEGSELCYGSYFSHRYLRLVTDKKETMILASRGGAFEIEFDDNGIPISEFSKYAEIVKCEPLEVLQFTLPKENRVIAIQFAVPDETGEWKTKTKAYRIKGNLERFPKGIIAISKPSNYRKKDERTSVWSAYPILYPFSISLDIVTSPLQAVSILIMGFDNHIMFWSCLLGGRCISPLG
ncbi:hypothetical protein CH352_13260 [Leptospira hartskeerlii]|uniref:Uncharacterized protein n=1 Tax=Leptospira hartskeerlii TaxID=2023177 RepID=A0A2M9XA83_9LEPT|nr:hypothetical protein [Leptospira hartskeerlii]PJZ24607.1 hypothetical protein CH357_16245 [Leptospira hartskeerlii]PJZ32780.1 hypothetical protein CH352_13260 [Leptospira hartskeerlii]